MDYTYIREVEISDNYKEAIWNLLHAYIDSHSNILIDECKIYEVQAI